VSRLAGCPLHFFPSSVPKSTCEDTVIGASGVFQILDGGEEGDRPSIYFTHVCPLDITVEHETVSFTVTNLLEFFQRLLNMLLIDAEFLHARCPSHYPANSIEALVDRKFLWQFVVL